MSLSDQLKRIPRRVWRLYTDLNSIIYRKYLEQRFPQFMAYHEQINEIRNEILPYYEQYISSISNAIMALSLDLSILILFLCNMQKPKRILDLGSGFSSFLFNYYSTRVNPKPLIWSVDDNPEWLVKTDKFLKSYNLKPDNLISWEDFSKNKYEQFDLVLHDLGSMQLRQETLTNIIPLVNHEGILILDDMHLIPYGPFARKVVKNLGLEYYNLKYYTKDKFNRFAYLVVGQ